MALSNQRMQILFENDHDKDGVNPQPIFKLPSKTSYDPSKQVQVRILCNKSLSVDFETGVVLN
jgi:hypothetical protein